MAKLYIRPSYEAKFGFHEYPMSKIICVFVQNKRFPEDFSVIEDWRSVDASSSFVCETEATEGGVNISLNLLNIKSEDINLDKYTGIFFYCHDSFNNTVNYDHNTLAFAIIPSGEESIKSLVLNEVVNNFFIPLENGFNCSIKEENTSGSAVYNNGVAASSNYSTRESAANIAKYYGYKSNDRSYPPIINNGLLIY